MSRRSRRGFWWAVLLIAAVGYFSRGRTNTAEKPEPNNPAPRVAERAIQIFKPSQPAKQPEPADLRRGSADGANSGKTGDETFKQAAKQEQPQARPVSRRSNNALKLRIVGVHDGDSITGLDASNNQFKIRLNAIDAPERGQPFANRAKQALSEMVFGKHVTVEVQDTDKYDRTVGRVLVNELDVNYEMVAQGMAWHYVKYDKSRELAEAERSARAAGRGLWADPHAVPPWDWRKLDKNERERKRRISSQPR